MSCSEAQALFPNSQSPIDSQNRSDQVLARETCADGMPSQMAKLPQLV